MEDLLMKRLPREELLRLSQERIGVAAEYDKWPVQIGMQGDPWRVLVASVMLNRTSHKRVRITLKDLFASWPTFVELAGAEPRVLEALIEPCGLHERRAKTLTTLAKQWPTREWNDARELKGVGVYIADALGLFCFGDLHLESNDHALHRYVDFLRTLEELSNDGRG
jgi:endonuclease III